MVFVLIISSAFVLFDIHPFTVFSDSICKSLDVGRETSDIAVYLLKGFDKVAAILISSDMISSPSINVMCLLDMFLWGHFC